MDKNYANFRVCAEKCVEISQKLDITRIKPFENGVADSYVAFVYGIDEAISGLMRGSQLEFLLLAGEIYYNA